MTYHYQLKKELEFDVFNNNKTILSNRKVYVNIDKLFTRDMLFVLMKSKLPDGTNYDVNYFVFKNVEVCMKSVCEMYKRLQKMKKYHAYSTLCLSMLEDAYEQD